MNFQFAVIDRSLTGLLVGFSFYPKVDQSDFSELNIYLLIIVLHFKFY
mgnify:CR=1 FL=1